MKTKTIYLYLISITVLIVFIALCIGSTGSSVVNAAINSVLHSEREMTTTADSDGKKTETSTWSTLEEHIVITEKGPYNDENKFNGPVEIIMWYWSTDSLVSIRKTENVTYVNGYPHGKSIITFIKTPPGNTIIDTICYNMGVILELCNEDDRNRENDTTAYDILVNRYPYYWYELLTLNYEEEYIRSYMDTLADIIASFEVDINEFEDFYEDAQDELENTVFDSLTLDNRDYSILRLLDLMQHCVFRHAIFDRYLKEINSIYLVILEFYPDFLQLMQEEFEINELAFEDYCTVFDSLLNSYGPLDTESYLFPDSLDTRIFRASQYIDSLGSSELQEANTAVAFLSIYEFYDLADIIYLCQREAYSLNNEIVDFPVVTTHVKNQPSDTEVEIEGCVVNDGGDDVTKRGVLWAQHYNPTMEDNQENAGSGTGLFSVTLNNLTPGKTYYARSFATNSRGTSYGNCLDFVAQLVTGTNEIIMLSREIKLYPNPASTFIDIVCETGNSEIENMHIYDIRGKRILSKTLNDVINGHLNLDITELVDGIYICKFNYQDGGLSVKKIVVAR